MTDASDPGSRTGTEQPTVSALFIYPVKSCRRVEVDRVTASAYGLVGDRHWQVSAGQKPVTQRQKTVLATVQPTMIDGGLRLSAPDHGTVEVETPTTADHLTETLVGGQAKVGDAGDEAAAWLGRLLDDDDVRLHAVAEGPFPTPPTLTRFAETMAFPDLAPVLVASTASLRWLLERAAEPFDMNRFRPNIVVTGSEPFAEDTWSSFTIGSVQLSAGLPWPRCPIPQIDQDDGSRHSEPARVLKAHRWCTEAPNLDPVFRSMVENSGLFGIGAGLGPARAEIGLGDSLTVTETQEPLIPSPT